MSFYPMQDQMMLKSGLARVFFEIKAANFYPLQFLTSWKIGSGLQRI